MVLPDLKALQALTQMDGLEWLEQYQSAHASSHGSSLNASGSL